MILNTCKIQLTVMSRFWVTILYALFANIHFSNVWIDNTEIFI